MLFPEVISLKCSNKYQCLRWISSLSARNIYDILSLRNIVTIHEQLAHSKDIKQLSTLTLKSCCFIPTFINTEPVPLQLSTGIKI
jgi:hypothetical protein